MDGTLRRSEHEYEEVVRAASTCIVLAVCTAANRRQPLNLTLLRPACNQLTKRLCCVRPDLFGVGILKPQDTSEKAGKMRLIEGVDLYRPATIRNNHFVSSVHAGRRRLHGTFYKLSFATCRVRVLLPTRTHFTANQNAGREESGAIPLPAGRDPCLPC